MPGRTGLATSCTRPLLLPPVSLRMIWPTRTSQISINTLCAPPEPKGVGATYPQAGAGRRPWWGSPRYVLVAVRVQPGVTVTGVRRQTGRGAGIVTMGWLPLAVHVVIQHKIDVHFTSVFVSYGRAPRQPGRHRDVTVHCRTNQRLPVSPRRQPKACSAPSSARVTASATFERECHVLSQGSQHAVERERHAVSQGLQRAVELRMRPRIDVSSVVSGSAWHAPTMTLVRATAQAWQ